MNLNPLALLDSILADYASPRARRAIHSLLLLAAVVVTVVLTAEGNWKAAIGALIAAIYAGANQANTPATPLAEASEGDDVDTDDDLTYAESGGLPFPADHDESALYKDDTPYEGTGPEDDDPYSDPHRY